MDLLSSLRRRWILASALLLLTLLATGAAVARLPSTYQAQSSVVLLAPVNAAKAAGGNPFLAFNATLNQTADVVRYETMDVRTANALTASGYPSTYQIIDAIDTSGPVLTVTVTGHNQADTEHTLYGVTAMLSTKLASLQTGQSSANTIRDLTISFTPKATSVSGKKVRSLSIVVGVGLVLTLGITMIVDATLIRRRMQPKDRRRGKGGDKDAQGADRPEAYEPDYRHAVSPKADVRREPQAGTRSEVEETRPQPIPERTVRRPS